MRFSSGCERGRARRREVVGASRKAHLLGIVVPHENCRCGPVWSPLKLVDDGKQVLAVDCDILDDMVLDAYKNTTLHVSAMRLAHAVEGDEI